MSQNILPTKPAELYQVILAFFSLLIIIVIGVVDINNRITALETKQIETDKFRIELRQSLEKIQDSQLQILIKLENKENKHE